jgi:acyl-coenzyme A thioesterase PaaI-like protein
VQPTHHELCFGCGRTNLFGLMLEVELTEPGAVKGRCFIKQDHQGAERGSAHEGVIAAALSEAMALACGIEYRAQRFELELTGRAAVGTFLEVQARAQPSGEAAAEARTADGEPVAVARGSFARR